MKLRLVCQTVSFPLLLLLGAAGSAFAQTPGAIDQVNSTQQRRSLQSSTEQPLQPGDNAPEIYPGESGDVGPQSVLAVKPRKTLVEGIADSEFFHTDNVFLDHSFHQSAIVLVSTAQIALAPTPYQLGEGLFAPRIGFRQQWYDFFEDHTHNPSFDNNDFNAQTIFTDERWMHGNWIAGAGFDYTRLLSTHDYSQFYAEYVPRWELQRIFPISVKQSFSLGYQGYYHFTHASATVFQQPQSSFYDRLDQVLLATYNFTPCPHAQIQPYYVFKYTHFTSNISREDYLNSVGLAVY
ncbi:MAG TPA: hypothetical protein VFC07_03160, partial [Verrucomicrobiae bacterium]|nr:hypothetical protein [Verrucomicrobiae bacterium]